MRHVVESVAVIAIILVAIILKEASGVEVKYVIVSGVVIILVYSLHLIIQYKAGAIVAKNFPWLYTVRRSSQTLYSIEEQVYANYNVYLVTPDLYNDVRDAITQNVVLSNLKRGVTYYYITRNDNLQAQAHILELFHAFSAYPHLVKVYAINELFGWIPTFNILVIEHDKHDRRRVFVELPVIEEARRHWWVEADITIAEHWHQIILQLLQQREPVPNPFSRSVEK